MGISGSPSGRTSSSPAYATATLSMLRPRSRRLASPPRRRRFARADTKGTGEAIVAHVEGRVELDTPLNIHLTGCHHSCAQHYIGDIGLIACKIDRGDDADPVEGFHLFVGGGSGGDARIGREL